MALALALAGCGDGDKYADRPAPPPSIPVGAAITPDGIDVSPSHFGAGLIKLVVTNLTASSQQLTVESTTGNPFKQVTSPINPQDTAQLKAQLDPGTYTVSVDDTRVRAARLAVGARRPAAVNQLP